MVDNFVSKLVPLTSILVPLITSVPSLLIFLTTELISNLEPSILALPDIFSLVIEPSVIPSFFTPFSSIKIV